MRLVNITTGDTLPDYEPSEEDLRKEGALRSFETMDSIFVYKNHLVYNSSNLLFTIVQNSIRFPKMKPLAVYIEGDYLGPYRIVGKNVFAAGKLSEMLSFKVFGSMPIEGLKELKTIKIKGRMSDTTKMAFICLEHINYEKKYSLQKEA